MFGPPIPAPLRCRSENINPNFEDGTYHFESFERLWSHPAVSCDREQNLNDQILGGVYERRAYLGFGI